MKQKFIWICRKRWDLLVKSLYVVAAQTEDGLRSIAKVLWRNYVDDPLLVDTVAVETLDAVLD